MANDRISACVSHGTTNLGDSTEALLLKSRTALVCSQRQDRKPNSRTSKPNRVRVAKAPTCPTPQESVTGGSRGCASVKPCVKEAYDRLHVVLRVRSRVSKRGWSCRSEKLGLWLVSFNSVRKVRVDLCRRAAVFGCFC